MANVDKESVRAEVIKLKEQFEKLSSAGKVNTEVSMLMSSMFMIIELILSIFLERTTRKGNRNSSIPSSQTHKDETTPGQSGNQSKGKRLNKHIAGNTRKSETVTISIVETCSICGEDLSQVETTETQRRTKIDIIFEKLVEHVDAEIKTCPICQHKTTGPFPGDMSGPLQYGNGLKAFVINLLVGQMVAVNRVQTLIESMINATVSETTLLKFVLRLHQALESWEAHTIKQVLKQPILNVDETSLRVDRKNHWIHVYAAGNITLKRLHRKRGKEAINDINIVPRYSGVIIHDCWASYFAYDNCDHGLCGSHLLRELTFIIESNEYSWAKNLKKLLQQTCIVVSESSDKKLSPKAYANLLKRYRNIITRGEKELPELPQRPTGKRGKLAKSDAHNLWERMKQHESSVLLFAKESHVPFTNNRAERDLRMAKVKQKVSGCFRNEEYAHAYCRISSYLQTMANCGYNPLIAIQMALAGQLDLDRGV
jgi:transposase